MKNYIVYNKEGKILKTGTCTDDSLHLKAQEGEFIIEGEADDRYQRVVDGKVVDILDEELKQKEIETYLRRPSKLIHRMNENNIDDILKDNLKDDELVEKFKKDNYSLLRQKFYPDHLELIDAEVKIKSENEDLQNQGKLQKDKYYSDCLKVKERFPKG